MMVVVVVVVVEEEEEEGVEGRQFASEAFFLAAFLAALAAFFAFCLAAMAAREAGSKSAKLDWFIDGDDTDGGDSDDMTDCF